MDSARGHDDLRHDAEPVEGGVGEPQVTISSDERRMHVRAYNHWVSLLHDRPYPAIGDLEPEGIADFGPHSVLLDFSGDLHDPAIQFIGRALREECGVDQSITRVAEVPTRSLLSRLTDHYLQIIANRAPVGFEAEFVGTRGHNMLYRGILMPFSSDSESIDYIYGVINWKELVAADDQASLAAELAAAVRAPRHDPVPAPAWADGPSGSTTDDHATTLDTLLAAARDAAASARTAASRSHAALYRALGRAHDVALAAQGDPDRLAALLSYAGIKSQARAPMTAIAKLVFGRDHDKTRLTEAATVLAWAQRGGVPEGGLSQALELAPGGMKGIVADERALRRPASPAPVAPRSLQERSALAEIALDCGLEDGAPVILLGRATAGGGIAVVGTIGDDARLAEQVLRRLA